MNKSAIIAIQASGNALTPQQKEFNRLCKKIRDLRQHISAVETATREVVERKERELRPLAEKFSDLQAQIVRAFDRYAGNTLCKGAERKKISYLIEKMCTELIAEGHDDLKAIYEKHTGDQFDEVDAEANARIADAMKEMVGQMFGIEFDPEADVSTPEKMQAYVEEKMAGREAEEADRKARRDAQRQAKPKTEKQKQAEEKRLAREQALAEETKKITKSVREVYMDLVKALHPDLEKDEAEKVRKTAILQRVTLAYEANDLLELLNLQMELERIDQEHLENLATDRLQLFNKVLREQVRELQEQEQVAEMELAVHFGPQMMYAPLTPLQSRHRLNQELATLRSNIVEAEQDLILLQDPQGVKEWLKGYSVPKKNSRPEDILREIFGF